MVTVLFHFILSLVTTSPREYQTDMYGIHCLLNSQNGGESLLTLYHWTIETAAKIPKGNKQCPSNNQRNIRKPSNLSGRNHSTLLVVEFRYYKRWKDYTFIKMKSNTKGICITTVFSLKCTHLFKKKEIKEILLHFSFPSSHDMIQWNYSSCKTLAQIGTSMGKSLELN